VEEESIGTHINGGIDEVLSVARRVTTTCGKRRSVCHQQFGIILNSGDSRIDNRELTSAVVIDIAERIAHFEVTSEVGISTNCNT